MLPTLLLWRAQLRAARRFAATQPDGAAATAQLELAGSAYERLCAPVLEAVDGLGGPGMPAALSAAVPVVVAGVLGFAASTLARDGGV